MTSETYKYLLVGLFSFVIVGSFYLVFKDGFKIKKKKYGKRLFRVQTKKTEGILLVIYLLLVYSYSFLFYLIDFHNSNLGCPLFNISKNRFVV